ncbi:glycosyltransferase [bacterium]|nr:glycosyltransferase [bacterium]
MAARFDQISVSVVMPTYNERDNIVPLIRETLKEIRDHFVCAFLEVIVVDDNSPDGTWQVAAEAGDPAVRVVRRMHDRGLRNSIWNGVEEARGEIVVWMDCDFSHPPRYIPQMLACVLVGWDIAVNSRYAAGGEDVREGKGTWLQRILSTLLNHFTWLVLGQSFRDYTSGFVAVRTSVVRELGLRGDYGEYFIDFIYRAIRAGRRVLELPYRNEPRAAGESKTGHGLLTYARRGWKYIVLLLAIRFGRLT